MVLNTPRLMHALGQGREGSMFCELEATGKTWLSGRNEGEITAMKVT